MAAIEIERHESPYSKNNPYSAISTSPVVAAGGGCCCCCCCCCSTSTFILPEAIVFSTLTRGSQLTKQEIFNKYLLIYGIGFVVIYVLGMLMTTLGRNLSILLYFMFGIGIPGTIGALIINPIVVAISSSRAIDSTVDKQPNGFFAFLIGIFTVAFYCGTILPILFGYI